MIELSETAESVLTRSHTRFLVVESWLDGELLAANIPITDAREETDRSLNVPERVTLTVPREADGITWAPDTVDAPLAANGQRLRVQLGIGIGNGETEWFQRGWFVITAAEVNGDEVNVSAEGLLTLVNEARLVSPYQPSGTLISTLRGLVEPALTVDVTNAPDDRAVPTDVNFDEDRLGAVWDLIDAWPAQMTTSADGVLVVTDVEDDPTPVLTLTDGTGGTIIRSTGSSTREGAYNVVVARGTASDGGQVQGVTYDTSDGPTAYGGPFNPLPVPYFYFSPLLTTVAQAQAASASILARKIRDVGLEFTVEMVPHPGLQVGDVVQITTNLYTELPCSVESLSLPYLPEGGSMGLIVRSVE